jgi:hypothetical protein
MLTKRLAYEKWLGIKDEHQPPSLYRLLAIDAFESDPDVISNAADSRLGFVRQFQVGENANLAAEILNEVTRAKIILLNPQKKAAYDAKLREGSWSNPDSTDGPLEAASRAKPIARARSLQAERPAAATAVDANESLDIDSMVAGSKPAESSKKQQAAPRRSGVPLIAILGAGGLIAACAAGVAVYLYMNSRQASSNNADKNLAASASPKQTAAKTELNGDTKSAKDSAVINKSAADNAKPADDATAQDDEKPKTAPPAGKARLSDEDRLAKEVTEITKRAKEVKTPEESRSLAEKAIVLVDRAIVLGKADTAKEVAVLTLTSARNAESVFLARQATIFLIQLQNPISDALQRDARQRLDTASAESSAETSAESSQASEEHASNAPSLRGQDDTAKNDSAKSDADSVSHEARWGKTEAERRNIFFDLLKAVDDYGMTPKGRKAWKEILARNEIDARVTLGILNEGFNTFSNWEQPDGGGKASSRMNRINWIGERTRTMSEPMLAD